MIRKQNNKKIVSMFMFIFIFLCFHVDVWAAAYYVDASASDDSGNGSSESPKKYIESGAALMDNADDTLIIRNGTYSTAKDQLTTIPSGTSGHYNTVKAENDGGVIITAASAMSEISGSYIKFEGLKVVNSSDKYVNGSYLKFMRCAFQGGSSGGNTVNFDLEGRYNLLEDCWFYGLGGRYKILIYRGSNLVLRRCVIRDDGGWTSNNSDPEAGVVVYESSNVALQNVIVIDSSLANYDNDNVGAFYVTGHSGNPSSDNLNFTGCIALNNKKAGWNNDTDDGGVGCSIKDMVIYGTQLEGIGTSNTSMNILIDGLTSGNVGDRFIGNWGDKSISVKNSVLFNSKNSSSGSSNFTYSNSYNKNDFSGTGVTHINPLTNGLLYLPRIENNTTLKTAGESGGQMGATILKKIGTSGTLYGESGYNTVTDDSLWPWPNENRIKTDFASVSGGVRGFAASGKQLNGTDNITLTSYIWEYLGNSIPAEIYAGTPTPSQEKPLPPVLRIVNE